MNKIINQFDYLLSGLGKINQLLILFLILALTPIRAYAQMVNPSIDRPDEPFCYFSKPTTEIGVMDGQWGTEITPEGYLYTGFGSFMFFTGNPPRPVNQRVKTLLDGYLPIVSYHFDRHDVRYTITAFSATLDGNPESPLMNFIRVTMKNIGEVQRAAFFGAGIRYQNKVNTYGGTGDNRFWRPAKERYLGGYSQAGVKFNPDWVYGFSGNAFLRSDSLMYLFPDEPAPKRMMTLQTLYDRPQNLTPRKIYILPTTPVGIVNYFVILKPGEEKKLDFKMPLAPIPAGNKLVSELQKAKFNEYLNKTVEFWNHIFSKGIDIQVPEAKVENTFKTSLVYDLIARKKEDKYYIQTVNDLQYHAFWLRDAAHIIDMYLLSDYPEIARQCLDFFPRWQKPDGNFLSESQQYDGWGQTMWIYGQYYLYTHNKKFAKSVFPSILKAEDWLKQARASDPLHLIPKADVHDNEIIRGHITGYDFWALDGLKGIIEIAKGLGKTRDAVQFQAEYNSLYLALMKQLKIVTAKTGGYIPPGLDGANPPGQDWGNMNTLYPEVLFPPYSKMVTATLDSTLAKYREGIMTFDYGKFLHDYLTTRNTEIELVRGEQEKALKALYAMLVHTSSTNAGFEFCIRPWGTRNFVNNLAPHGRFAAEIRILLRNMLVREQDNDLHLLSCISPDWVKEGEKILVQRAPTYFGEVNFVFDFKNGGATLTMDNHFTVNPKNMILHLPWFEDVHSVTADGKKLRIRDSKVSLPINTRKIEIKWTKRANVPTLSYNSAVQSYEKENEAKYAKFLKTGK